VQEASILFSNNPSSEALCPTAGIAVLTREVSTVHTVQYVTAS
jgi:hypothetical protein